MVINFMKQLKMNNNYVILSPGRCASVFLAQYLIHKIRIRDNILFKFKHFDKSFQTEYSKNNSVIHLHNFDDLSKYYQPNDYLIVLRRNPVDAAASNLIAFTTKTYNFKQNKVNQKHYISKSDYIEKYKDVKFEFKDDEFLLEVKRYLNWYVNADHLKPNLILNFNQATDCKYLDRIFDFEESDVSDLANLFSQPFDRWSKIKDGEKLRTLGNELFRSYNEKYPHIFSNNDFSY